MTTSRITFATLRSLAASRVRGHLSGSTGSSVSDRDLDRIAADLLVLSESDPVRRTTRTR